MTEFVLNWGLFGQGGYNSEGYDGGIPLVDFVVVSDFEHINKFLEFTDELFIVDTLSWLLFLFAFDEVFEIKTERFNKINDTWLPDVLLESMKFSLRIPDLLLLEQILRFYFTFSTLPLDERQYIHNMFMRKLDERKIFTVGLERMD